MKGEKQTAAGVLVGLVADSALAATLFSKAIFQACVEDAARHGPSSGAYRK